MYEQILFLFFRNLQKNGLATQLVKVKLLSQLKNNIKEQHNMERRIKYQQSRMQHEKQPFLRTQ